MRILLLGASGYVGHYLAARLAKEHELVGTFRYEERDYPDNDFDRYERRYTGNAVCEIPIYEWFKGYAGVVYMSVDSNKEMLEYERWIYTLGLMADL